MFCTLTLEERKKRFCRNLIIEEKQIGEIKFIKATAYKRSSIKRLEKKLKDRVDMIILSDNLKDLKFKKLKVYNNRDYIKRIAMYTFTNIIRLSKIPANQLSICITDKACEFSDYIFSIANKVAIIRIVTNNIDEYAIVSDKIYNDYGMSPIILNKEEKSDLGIIFDYENPRIWFNAPENYSEITPKCIKLGAGLKGFVPKNINEADFAGVLKDFKDFRRLNLLNADLIFKNNKYFKINSNNIKNFLDIDDEYW